MHSPWHKGPEIAIPVPYPDKEGISRFEARYRWWSADAGTSLRAGPLIPKGSKTTDGGEYPPLPQTPLDEPPPVEPYSDAVPVLYGHYWETGTPTITSDRTACVDYSVAKGRPLVAYRWQGEPGPNTAAGHRTIADWKYARINMTPWVLPDTHDILLEDFRLSVSTFPSFGYQSVRDCE